MTGRRLAALLLVCLSATLDAQSHPPTFIQISVDHTTPFVGQPFTLTIQAFDSTRTPGLQLSYPSLAAFGQQPPGEILMTTEVLDGLPYIRYTQHITLFPSRVGTFVLDPAALIIPETPLQAARVLKSNQLLLTVRPLPSTPPDAYLGIVGQLSAQVLPDTRDLSASQALSLTLRLSGSPALSRVLTPALIISALDWRALPPERRADDRAQTLDITWRLLPQRSGTLPLPVVTAAWFDPHMNQFVTYQNAAQTVSVAPGVSALILPAPTPPPTPPATAPARPSILPTTTTALTPPLALWAAAPAAAIVCWLLRRRVGRGSRRTARPSPPADLRPVLLAALTLPPAHAFPRLHTALHDAILARAAAAGCTIEDWLATLPAPLQDALLRQREALAAARFAPATPQDTQYHAQEIYRAIRAIDRWSADS